MKINGKEPTNVCHKNDYNISQISFWLACNNQYNVCHPWLQQLQKLLYNQYKVCHQGLQKLKIVTVA